jgi:hypothetical protein
MLSGQHRNLWHTHSTLPESSEPASCAQPFKCYPSNLLESVGPPSGLRKICTKVADFASIGQIGALESAASGKNG